MQARIHSIETMGTVDGPGIRYVVFTQGCPMRCAYCHNPDTWNMHGGREITPLEILTDYERYRNYYRDGGITVTGGEPMVWMDFLIELFSMAKKRNIHTCLDTSGVLFHPDDKHFMKKCSELQKVTDLVMLDIKHINAEKHMELTGHSNTNILDFARWLDEKDTELWIRHVVVPGITFDQTALVQLGEFLATLQHLKALDILPYHSMGKVKYEKLGISYPLKDTKELTKQEAVAARQLILQTIRKVKGVDFASQRDL